MLHKILAVSLVLFAAACGSMDDAPDSPDAAIPMVDAGPMLDADPCTMVIWDASDKDPPFAALFASRDQVGQPLPIVFNPEGGLGVGDDAVIDMDEGLTITFDQPARLYEYRVRGDGSHQAILALAPSGTALLIESESDGQVGVGREVQKAELKGVSDGVVLEQMMYRVCDQTGAR